MNRFYNCPICKKQTSNLRCDAIDHKFDYDNNEPFRTHIMIDNIHYVWYLTNKLLFIDGIIQHFYFEPDFKDINKLLRKINIWKTFQ